MRLYVHNSFRGLNSIRRFGEFILDDCSIVFDNRLESSKRKMQVVRKDKHGKLFEVRIPVDGVADFHFERENLESGYEGLTKFYFGGALDYMGGRAIRCLLLWSIEKTTGIMAEIFIVD